MDAPQPHVMVDANAVEPQHLKAAVALVEALKAHVDALRTVDAYVQLRQTVD